MSRRLALAVAALFAAWGIGRWRPRTMRLSDQTLADIARREDRGGLGEVNTKDAHPFAAEHVRVFPTDRPGVDPSFARGRR